MRKIGNLPWRQRSAPIGAALGIVLLMLPIQVWSAPQVSLYRNDAQRTGRTPYECPRSPLLSWTYNIPAGCSATPVVGRDGTLYFGAYDKNFYAVVETREGTQSRGTTAWSFTANGLIKSSAAIGSDNSMYFGTAIGSLYAVREDGSAKWPSPVLFAGSSVAGPPLIASDGRIYLASENRNVYAVSADGAVLWSRAIAATPKHGLAMSPSGAVVYTAASDGSIYAVNTDGSSRWKSQNVFANSICAVGDDGTIYVGGTNNRMYALNTNGTVKWFYSAFGRISAGAAVGLDGTIYFGSQDHRFYALRPDGTLKWVYEARDSIFSAPTIDRFGTVLFGVASGDLLALNGEDGSAIWNKTVGSSIYTSPIIAADGTVYVIDSGGVLSKFAGPVSAVPEPSSLMGCLAALAGFAFCLKRASRGR